MPTDEEEEEKVRHIKLRKCDFKKYGHAEECAGCVRMRRGTKPQYRHNKECRKRMEKAIRRDDAERWERYQVRMLVCYCYTRLPSTVLTTAAIAIAVNVVLALIVIVACMMVVVFYGDCYFPVAAFHHCSVRAPVPKSGHHVD